jgi:antitoxin VapB
MPSQTAKIFMNGRSQAVRLPKEYRFDTDEVYISKQGQMSLFLPKNQLGMNSLILNQRLMMIF